MRADRLLSLLLLLQSRGRMTAADLARRLEVSERTVYRDISALSTAGVPVYAERGPGGGCMLMDGYRTNLTGLTGDEARTLFMAGTSRALTELGLGGALDAALLKVLAALPAAHRQEAERARQRLHLDPAGWNQSEEEVPHLRVIQEAVWRDRRLRLTHRRGDGEVVERVVDPLGLVAKASIWYLVSRVEDEMRVFRLSRTLAAELLDEPCERPPDFDLVNYWATWRDGFKASLPKYPVTLRASPELAPQLPHLFGNMWTHVGEPDAAGTDADGWATLRVTFETEEAARTSILGCGAEIEVLEPLALREQIVRFATETAAFYAARAESAARDESVRRLAR